MSAGMCWAKMAFNAELEGGPVTTPFRFIDRSKGQVLPLDQVAHLEPVLRLSALLSQLTSISWKGPIVPPYL